MILQGLSFGYSMNFLRKKIIEKYQKQIQASTEELKQLKKSLQNQSAIYGSAKKNEEFSVYSQANVDVMRNTTGGINRFSPNSAFAGLTKKY